MKNGSAAEAINWRPVKEVQVLQQPTLDADASGVLAGLAAADELARCQSLDALLKRAVELARDRLGLERISLFLNDEPREILRGTWSTNAQGELVDERHVRCRFGELAREAHRRVEAGVGRWLQLCDVTQAGHEDGKPAPGGRTWQILTPVRSLRGPVGVLHNAAAFAKPFDVAKQVRAAVFASLIGNAIDAMREPTPLARVPQAGAKCGALVRETIAALNEDPTLTADAIAARLSVSPARLARTFRAEVSVSLVQYRNRLRLERFLGLVQHSGGSFAGAAHTAGFGSYAQFHRIFRKHVGVAPREYLGLRAAV